MFVRTVDSERFEGRLDMISDLCEHMPPAGSPANKPDNFKSVQAKVLRVPIQANGVFASKSLDMRRRRSGARHHGAVVFAAQGAAKIDLEATRKPASSTTIQTRTGRPGTEGPSNPK